MMWPFKSKLSACTFTWYYLFLNILGNEILKFGRNLPLAMFGKKRVKNNRKTKITWDKKLTKINIICTWYWAVVWVWVYALVMPFHYFLHIIISFHSDSTMKATWKSENTNDSLWAKQQLIIIMHQCPLYNYYVKLPNVTFFITYMYKRWGEHNNKKNNKISVV